MEGKMSRCLTIKWGFLLLLLIPEAGLAATRFVSPSGSGAICSTTVPCSMTTGLAHTESGDTLIFKDGVYDQAISYRDVVSGQSDNQRTLYRAENFRGAVLRPTIGAYTGEGCNC